MNFFDEWPPVGISMGADMILAERRRQIEEEGYDAEHDAQHPTGALSKAARCYAADVRVNDPPPVDWPWDSGLWRPGDAVCNLVRAGALLAAEIDLQLNKWEVPDAQD